MENTPFLYFPVKNPIDQKNLFGTPSPMYAAMGQNGHPGIDFEAPLGTPLYAPCDGDAFYTTDKEGGDGFWIRYPDNALPQYDIILWHMPNAGNPTYPFQIPTAANVVTKVKAGELLGYTGNSGYPQESTGPHLHVGVIPCDTTGAPLNPNNGFKGCVDPMPFFNKKYAEDIDIEAEVIQKSAQVVSLVSQASDQQIPHQDKLNILTAVEQFIKSLLP